MMLWESLYWETLLTVLMEYGKVNSKNIKMATYERYCVSGNESTHDVTEYDFKI